MYFFFESQVCKIIYFLYVCMRTDSFHKKLWIAYSYVSCSMELKKIG